MAGTRIMWVVGAWLGLMLLSAGAELSTVAYVVDRAGFAELGSEWHWRNFDEVDPFAEVQEEPEKFAAPVRLEHKPNGSRFFAEGDEMWLMTGTLRQQGVLTHERTWAVWNADRNRLVVHGTMTEHALMQVLWEDMNPLTLMATSVELVKVRCRELGAVEWTEEEVRKREGKAVHVIRATNRPGMRSTVVMGTEDGEVLLEVEPNTGRNGGVVDLRLHYDAAVRHRDGARQLTVGTGLAIFPERTIYSEVGEADEHGQVYLLGVQSQATCLDGTPRWRWREYEDVSMQDEPPEIWNSDREFQEIEGGMILSRISVPPTFLEDIQQEEGEEPFVAREPIDGETLAEAMHASLRGVPQLLPSHRVFDLTDFMRDFGLNAPDGGWIYYNLSRSSVLGKLDAETTDLLDALTMSLGPDAPRMIRGTVSLIEWEGELEPGKIPAGARRLARMGAVQQPGQKVTVRHGWPVEDMERGSLLSLEANIGANDRMVDLRVEFTVVGRHAASVVTALTLENGRPVVVPLGEVEGKKRGLVVEGRILDAAGREVEE